MSQPPTGDLLAGLNDRQRAAVTAAGGPVLVLAGPGSGKTRVLTRRIAYLINEMQIAPHTIMAVTFTNKAATEMRHRVQAAIGMHTRGLQIGTFHATCARILRTEYDFTPYDQDFVIYDTDDQLNAVGQAMNEGKLIREVGRRSEVARDISVLMAFMTDDTEGFAEEAAKDSSGGSFFFGLFGGKG